MEKLSRRDFLKLFGAGGLGVASLSLLGTWYYRLHLKTEKISTKPVYIDVDKERISDVVKILSHSNYQGRRSGTSGEAEAGLFIAQELQQLNLLPMGEWNTFFQAFPLPKVELRKAGERTEFFVVGGQTNLKGDNVLGALISDKNPQEFIILSAHYDHLGSQDGKVFPGANDNCSGVSALLEIARVLKTKPDLPYSILFAFWSGEEMGLVGSNYFVSHPTVDINKIKLNINLDSIGIGPAKDFLLWTTGPERLIDDVIDSWSQWDGITFEVQTNPSNSSDHKALGRVAIPALTVLAKGWLEGNHTYLDTAQSLNYEKIRSLSVKLVEFLQWDELKEMLS